MEEILKVENLEKLYSFLITDFKMKKIDEKLDSKFFGNFFVLLSAEIFFLRYINDRSFLTIEIASKTDSEWLDLSFIKNFIYDKEKINVDERNLSNEARIEELNNFLKKDFDKINFLYNEQNYPEFKQEIMMLLKMQFRRRFP